MAARRQRQEQRKQKAPEPPDASDIVGAITGGGSSGSSGGGTSSGGTSSGSSSASAAQSQAAANAKRKKLLQAQLKDRRREALRNVRDTFAGLDIPVGPFRKIIVRHIRQEIRVKGKGDLGRITGPTTPRMNLLLQDVVDSKKFRQRFPGFDNLTAQGMSVSQALGAYKQFKDDIAQIAKDFGYAGPMGKNELAALLNGGVDKTEFANRLLIMDSITANKSTLDAFNQILQSQGKPPLDLTGQMDFLAGTAAKDFYDTYEQAFLQGIGVTSAAARTIARAVGLPGEVAQDLSALPSALASLRDVAGQEFRQLGLDETALTLAALSESGANLGDLDAQAREHLQVVRQQIKNRTAALQSRGGVQPRMGPRGEPLLPAGAGVESL